MRCVLGNYICPFIENGGDVQSIVKFITAGVLRPRFRGNVECRMDMHTLALAALACLTTTAALAETVQLTCKYDTGGNPDVFLVDNAAKSAAWVSQQRGLRGEVIVSPHRYILVFRTSKASAETRVEINRYTGRMMFEWGFPPFFQANKGNIWQLGNCSRSEPKKLF